MLTPLLSKTKIVATVGPACDSQEILEKMILAGVSVFRFNTKHGTHQWHNERMMRVKKASLKVNKPVAILMDLQGPELRIGNLKGDKLELKKGEKVYFSPKEYLNKKTIIFDYPKILKRIQVNQKIFLADGLFELRVIKNEGGNILAEVLEGGTLYSKKNITLPGVNLDLPTLIKRDLENISLAAKNDVDFIALSFVRNKEDIEILRRVLKENNLEAKIIAKIELQEAIKNFEEILLASDGVMVARGDLGVQIPIEKVPFYQKLIIQRCRDVGKPVITATQMLESMIKNPRPTRAEVNDIANTVYDGTDAIMLSAESATGNYPLRAVEVMTKIASFIEEKREASFNNFIGEDQTAAIVLSAYNLINSFFKNDPLFKGFCVFTETGRTVRYLSRLRPSYPIYAFSQSEKVRDQLCLSWGVTPFFIKKKNINSGIPQKEAVFILKERGLIKKGEKIIMIYGSHWGVPGKTNTLKIESG